MNMIKKKKKKEYDDTIFFLSISVLQVFLDERVFLKQFLIVIGNTVCLAII